MSRLGNNGFTLIELLLSVTVISIIAATSMPLFVTYQNQNEIHLKGQEITSMLRRAQLYARTSNDNSEWSVAIQSGAATLYKGTTYATRDVSLDETTVLPASITPSGLSAVTFSKLTGIPTATGSITLSSDSHTRTISLNSVGMVAN